MEEKMKAMKISSKIISIIMKIGYIVMIVAMCISAAVLVFMLATGGQTSVETSGGTHITVADSLHTTPEALAAACASLLVMSAFLFVIFLLAHRIFKGISLTGIPFDEKYVGLMKAIGILVAAMSVMGGVAELIAAPYMGAETISVYNNAPGVVTGVIIFCLSYIFDYGCALQKRHDAMRQD